MPDIKITSQQMMTLEQAAINCPVAKSLHPDIKQTILFNF